MSGNRGLRALDLHAQELAQLGIEHAELVILRLAIDGGHIRFAQEVNQQGTLFPWVALFLQKGRQRAAIHAASTDGSIPRSPSSL